MSFSRAVVVGGGTMGRGIAHACALCGIETTLVDIDAAVLDDALATVEANLNKGVNRGKVSTEQRDAALKRLSTSTTRDALSEADLMIEAVIESMAVKKEIFEDADKKMPAGAVLASNTSSLSITEIAAATKRADDVIGLHFFNPAHIMKLLEIVRGASTSDAVVERCLALAEQLGKQAITVNDAPGFATSRLGITLGNEAMRMVAEGVAGPRDIDSAMKLGYGHPMGPLALTDLVGLDVRLHISSYLYDELGTDVFRPPPLLRKLVRAGCLGKKSGRGFYLWRDGQIVEENPLCLR